MANDREQNYKKKKFSLSIDIFLCWFATTGGTNCSFLFVIILYIKITFQLKQELVIFNVFPGKKC